MRIWDLDVGQLCRAHLLAEHRELHGLWNILTQDKTGYRRHPETRRWDGRLRALYERHEAESEEMARRGWNHRSPLDRTLTAGSVPIQTLRVNTIEEQVAILLEKGCACRPAASPAGRKPKAAASPTRPARPAGSSRTG